MDVKKPSSSFEPLLDPRGASALLQIHEKTIIRMARTGMRISGLEIANVTHARESEVWFRHLT
jgi:hypothetical protein